MPSSSSRYALGPSLHRGHEVGERVQSNEMGTSVLIMQPILRFLQLLCENHNRDLQVRPRPAPPLPKPPLAAPHSAPLCPRPRSLPAPLPVPCPSLYPAPPPKTCTYSAPGIRPGHHGMCGSEAGEAPIPAAHVIVVPGQALPPWAGPPSVLQRRHAHPSPSSAELPALPEQ